MKSTKTTIQQTADILKVSNKVAIFAHTRPDGDTLGASIALCRILQNMGKDAEVYCDTTIDCNLHKYYGITNVKSSYNAKHDLFVAVDCGDLGRLGEFGTIYSRHSNTMTIDHHGGEYYSRYNCVIEYASTCQLIYEIAQAMAVDFDIEIATMLYMGLCTDTGNFAHSNTNRDCFAMASHLLQYDVPIADISTTFFKDTTLGCTRMQGLAMSRVRMYLDNRVALVYADKCDYDKLGVDISSTEGMVQSAINIDCAEIGIAVSYYSDNCYKVSMRSKKHNVRVICQQFGGGGHILASGCMIGGFFEDVVEKIIRQVGFEIC